MQIILGRRCKHIEVSLPRIADLEHRGHIPTSIAIIRRRPHRAQSIVIQHLVAFLAELMGAQNMVHAIHLEELPDHLRPKGISGAPRAQRELVPLRVRVRPHQIRHRALVRDLPEAVDDFDLVDGVDAGREAAVHAEDLVADDDGQRQEVEHVGEVVPDVGVAVLAGTLGVEAVGLCDAPRLVVAADEVDALGVAELEAHEERDGLDAKHAAVHVVAWRRSIWGSGSETWTSWEGCSRIPGGHLAVAE